MGVITRLAKWTSIAVVCLGGLYVVYKLSYPDYVYRYRLELTLEVDGVQHAGSSVIEVRWIGAPSIEGHGSYSSAGSLYGQAPLIDLGERGIILVALMTGEGYGRSSDGSYGALWLCANAFNNDSSKEGLRILSGQTGRRRLSPDNFPRLMWLRDRSRPESARKIVPDELQSLLGPGARFTSAFVEMTREPVLIDIGSKLPWLFDWVAKLKEQKLAVSRPGEVVLRPNMILGDAQ